MQSVLDITASKEERNVIDASNFDAQVIKKCLLDLFPTKESPQKFTSQK